MGQAVIKLVGITFVTLILVFFAVFMVRTVSSRAGFGPPTHPWFQKSFWWVFTPTLDQLCGPEKLESLIPTKDWIVEIPVRRKGQFEDWQIPCKNTSPINLSEYLDQSAHHDWILKVESHDTWGLDKLVEIVQPHLNDSRFALISDAQKVAMYLRKKAPEWLFAADASSLVRLRLFESLWLETAIDFWPDFVVMTFDEHEAFHLDTRGADELQRRKKRVVWNWGSNDNPKAESPVEIQGVMTGRPTEALEKFKARL